MAQASQIYGPSRMIDFFKDFGWVGSALVLVLGVAAEALRQSIKNRAAAAEAKRVMEATAVKAKERAEDMAREVLQAAHRAALEERDRIEKRLDREREDRQRIEDSRQREVDATLHHMRGKLQTVTNDLELAERRSKAMSDTIEQMEHQHEVDIENMKRQLAAEREKNALLMNRVADLELRLKAAGVDPLDAP